MAANCRTHTEAAEQTVEDIRKLGRKAVAIQGNIGRVPLDIPVPEGARIALRAVGAQQVGAVSHQSQVQALLLSPDLQAGGASAHIAHQDDFDHRFGAGVAAQPVADTPFDRSGIATGTLAQAAS